MPGAKRMGLITTALGSACAWTAAGAQPPRAAPTAAASPPRLEITEWRYRDGLEPSATAAAFDDSKWEVIRDAAKGRGGGGLSFGWYRTVVTVPPRLGSIPVARRPLQLTVLADEYAEVWVDGAFDFQFDPAQPPNAPKNRSKGHEIAGFNKANVVPLGIRAPGDRITVAVLAVNGPIALPVGKYAIRYARLEPAPLPPSGKPPAR